MPRGIVRLLGLFIVLTMVIAACGDSGGDATTTTGEGPGTTVDGNGDNGDNGDGGNTIGTIGTLGNIPGISSECQALAEVMLGFSQIFIGASGDFEQVMASAADKLPSDLTDDIAVVTAALGEYLEVIDSFDIDLTTDPAAFANLTPEQQQQIAAATEALATPEVEAAFDNLEAYGEQECADIGLGN